MKLERSNKYFEDESNKQVLITPAIGEDYWKYRAHICDDQYILGFPKFCTIGIGFSKEEDWNTNLPYTTPAEEIWIHIKHNRKYIAATHKKCIKAIEMIQAAILEDKETEK